jgi:hypothetical protein
MLEYLAVAEDGSGVNGHAARAINVAARFVQAGTWLSVRFCLLLEPRQSPESDPEVTEGLVQIPGHIENVVCGNGLRPGACRILGCA